MRSVVSCPWSVVRCDGPLTTDNGQSLSGYRIFPPQSSDDKQHDRADDDKHHVLPQPAGLDGPHRKRRVPSFLGECIDSVVDDPPITDHGNHLRSPTINPSERMENGIDDAAVERSGYETADRMSRPDEHNIV